MPVLNYKPLDLSGLAALSICVPFNHIAKEKSKTKALLRRELADAVCQVMVIWQDDDEMEEDEGTPLEELIAGLKKFIPANK